HIPRNFKGYDESHNSRIIASYLSRTNLRPADPVVDRMHILTDGLLAVSDVPPLEVATSLTSLPAARFRSIARRLMHDHSNALELQQAVDAINCDVKSFERKKERLTSWKIQSVVGQT